MLSRQPLNSAVQFSLNTPDNNKTQSQRLTSNYQKITTEMALYHFIQHPLLSCFRPHQTAAMAASQANLSSTQQRKMGSVLPPGSGKTLLMLGAINMMYNTPYQYVDTLIIVPSECLIEQTTKKIIEYATKGYLPNFPTSEEAIGQWYAAKKILKPITITTYASWVNATQKSLARFPNKVTFEKNYTPYLDQKTTEPDLFFSPFHTQKIVAFDEAHHLGAGNAKTYLEAFGLHYCETSKEVNYIKSFNHKKVKTEMDNSSSSSSSSSSASIYTDSIEVEENALADDNHPIFTMIEEKQLNKKGPVVLAYTATPINETLYNRIFTIDYKLTIDEAINSGILSPMQFVEVKINNQEEVENLRNKLGLGQLKRKRNKPSDVEIEEFTNEQLDIVDKFITTNDALNLMLISLLSGFNRGQAIVFMQTIANVNALYEIAKKVMSRPYGGMEVFKLTSEQTANETQRIESQFRQSRHGVLINCKKVGEGQDYPEVECILDTRVYKNVTAPIIQGAGRATRPLPYKLATYIWLNLQIGQLNPAQVILNKKLYNLGGQNSGRLISPSILPRGLKNLTYLADETGFDGLELEVTTPKDGVKVIYRADGTLYNGHDHSLPKLPARHSTLFASTKTTSESSSSAYVSTPEYNQRKLEIDNYYRFLEESLPALPTAEEVNYPSQTPKYFSR